MGNWTDVVFCSQGFTRVFAVDRSRFHYRMAKQCVKENPRVEGSIALIDQKLEMCEVVPPEEASSDASPDGSPADRNKKERNVTRRVKVVVTDMMDHGCLGFSLLNSIDYAGAHLATPDAVCVPGRVTVRAALISLRTELVSRFDLRSLNQYRWHPQAAKFLNLLDEPHQVLSDHFEVADIDLTQRLRDAFEAGGTKKKAGDAGDASDSERFGGAAEFESDTLITVKPVGTGVWNAVAFWFELDLGDGRTLRSATPPGGDVSHGDGQAVSGNGSQSSVTDANSWGVAVQYLDELPVERGGSPVTLRIRRDANQIMFTSTPPQTRPRHSNIPQWHYDMLNDVGRNDAYEAAIKAAVTRVSFFYSRMCN